MLRKLYLMGAVMALSFNAIAQTDSAAAKKSNFSFSGSVDGYFRTDFAEDAGNNRTSFTNSTGKLALGMVSARLDYTAKKFSFTADLGVGKRAKEFAYNDKGILASVKQLYVAYAATDWLKLTAGSWATHVGYELVDPFGNRNYSMSYMFSYGPFLHTGAKADLTFGGTGLMIGVASPTDYRNAPDPNKKALLFQFSQAITDGVKLYLNYVGAQRPSDSAKTSQFDMVLTAKLSDKFNIGLNGTVCNIKTQKRNVYGDAASWSGIATYLNFDPIEKFGITLRSEIFNDKNQLAALGAAKSGASIFANTISGNIKLGGFTIVPELRLESAGENVFFTKSGTATGSATSFLLAAYYKF
jgi:hypothetical protein